MTTALLRSILALHQRRESGVLCTIVKTEGSTPLKTGAQMLVRNDGSIAGTIGGGALEHAVIKQARATIPLGESRLVEHRLTRDHNMCCGGTVHVYVEAIEIPPQCFIFGAGHVGKALATLLSTLDIEVVLIDGRPNMLDKGYMAEETIRYINEEPDKTLPALHWDSNTFAIIATHSHPLDRELLRLALLQPFKYCGMIGSKRKVIVTRKLFLERGWATADALDQIDMPIGIDIAAESPAEIAVSIAARIIEVKNRKKVSHSAQAGNLAEVLHQLNPEYTNDFACATATL